MTSPVEPATLEQMHYIAEETLHTLENLVNCVTKLRDTVRIQNELIQSIYAADNESRSRTSEENSLVTIST